MKSIWLTGKEKTQINQVQKTGKTEVCIIGAGIFGLSTAYYLSNAGVDCLVIDQDGIACKTTGHTTAKITSQHGLIYHYLVDTYGLHFAKQYFTANESAIGEIEKIIRDNQIACDFSRKTHTMYTRSISDKKKVEEEIPALEQITKQAGEVTETELPFPIELGVCMKNQAQFHPIQYVSGLARVIQEKGGKIYLDTHCYQLEKEKDGYHIATNQGEIIAKKVVLATHYPFLRFPGWYFLKMYQSTSYAIGISTKKQIPSNLYLQVENPKLSFRPAVDNEGREILILGGYGHKTGKAVTRQMTYGKLEQTAKQFDPDCEIRYWWSTRDCVTLDKIPYIGQFSNFYPDIYVGTGFNKWGMTSSNVAARIIYDAICGKENPYAEVFTATRMKPIQNRGEVKNMLVDSAKTIVGRRLQRADLTLADISQGEGGIIAYQGEKVGVYRAEDGKIYGVKPVCTHLGCLLNWNGADKTWDCPCHGSRFNYDGKNLYDPAIEPLEKVEVQE